MENIIKMKKTNNFINIVALGNFNPAILSPLFLKEKCEFNNESIPKGETTSVATQIIYGNISFLMGIERFEIKEINVSNFSETIIVKFMNKYLEVLDYTPVYILGVNLNVEIEKEQDEVISNLNNKKKLLEVLKSNDILYTLTTVCSKEIESNVLWELKKIANEETANIMVHLKKNKFSVNYNVETGKNAVKIDNKNYFSKNFDRINKEFQYFIENIF